MKEQIYNIQTQATKCVTFHKKIHSAWVKQCTRHTDNLNTVYAPHHCCKQAQQATENPRYMNICSSGLTQSASTSTNSALTSILKKKRKRQKVLTVKTPGLCSSSKLFCDTMVAVELTLSLLAIRTSTANREFEKLEFVFSLSSTMSTWVQFAECKRWGSSPEWSR